MSESKQAPIARLHVQGGEIAGATMYAPGLPDGEHDLYCVAESIAPFAADSACVWREELEHDGTLYETSCGQPFVLDEPPSEVGMRYCCFCGRRLQQESRSSAEGRSDE